MTYSSRLMIGLLTFSLCPLAVAQEGSSAPLAAIDNALAEAEAQPNLRFSYTMSFESPGNPTIVTRYDAEADEWQLQSGDPDELPGAIEQKFKNVKKSESVPGGLLYADFRPYLEDITFRQEADDEIIYAFVPPEANAKETSAELDRVMTARLVVDKDDGHLSKYEVRALEPFKPMPIAKLEEFAVVQDFERLGGDGPAVLTRLYARTKGSRAFRKIDTEFTATFSDIVAVD